MQAAEEVLGLLAACRAPHPVGDSSGFGNWRKGGSLPPMPRSPLSPCLGTPFPPCLGAPFPPMPGSPLPPHAWEPPFPHAWETPSPPMPGNPLPPMPGKGEVLMCSPPALCHPEGSAGCLVNRREALSWRSSGSFSAQAALRSSRESHIDLAPEQLRSECLWLYIWPLPALPLCLQPGE